MHCSNILNRFWLFIKKYWWILIISLVPLLTMTSCYKPNQIAEQVEYGVFLGISNDKISRLEKYKTVVIEPQEFSKENIEKLHNDKKFVYGYLNIGAIENYRPYYNEYKDITLGTYEDWPDERWVDVSKSKWQNFVVNNLAKSYKEKNFDGLFLDNFDVYYHYERPEIFKGLCDICIHLKNLGFKLLINGGDTFVSKCIENNNASSYFDGINQETVFTSINFKNKTYGKQEVEQHKYFIEYLKNVKQTNLSVYLLEYGANNKLLKEIDDYCKENGFGYYNASTLELK